MSLRLSTQIANSWLEQLRQDIAALEIRTVRQPIDPDLFDTTRFPPAVSISISFEPAANAEILLSGEPSAKATGFFSIQTAWWFLVDSAGQPLVQGDFLSGDLRIDGTEFVPEADVTLLYMALGLSRGIGGIV